MRIGIDTTAMRRTATGVETYIRSLVIHLARAYEGSGLFVFANAQDIGTLRRSLPSNVRVIPVAFRWRPSRTLAHQVLVVLWARHLHLDVLHSTAFSIAFGCPCAQVLTVQDMTFYTLPAPVRPPVDVLFRRVVMASIWRADRIIVPSEATKTAVQRLCPDLPVGRICVVPLGVEQTFGTVAPDAVEAVRRRLGINREYILYLGMLEPRKNLPRLVRAYSAAVTQDAVKADLVLAGKWGWHKTPLKKALREVPPEGRVLLPGYVSQQDARALYSGARLFVYPSTEEGFGLPPLEAMACGTPVVSSNRSSMAELLTGAAILIDPLDEMALTKAIASLLRNDELACSLRRAGSERVQKFSWESTAMATLACYREAMAERQRRPTR